MKLLRVVPTCRSSVYYALQQALHVESPLMEYLSQNPVAISVVALDGEDDEEDEAKLDPNARKIHSL